MRSVFWNFCMVLLWFMLHCKPKSTASADAVLLPGACAPVRFNFLNQYPSNMARWNCYFRKGEFEFEEKKSYTINPHTVKKIIGFKVTDRKTDSLTLDWYVRREKPENEKFNFIYGKEIHSFKTVYADKERRSGLYRLFLIGNYIDTDYSYELVYE